MKPVHSLLLLGLLAAAPDLAAAQARGLDVRDLQALDRVSAPTLSPDGALVVFAKREIGKDLGKASTGLWIRDLRTRDMAGPKRLTPVGWSVNSPSFSADGRTVYFLSSQGGSQQLYAIATTGGAPRQVSRYPLDVGSYKLNPDDSRVALSFEVFTDCAADLACTVKRLDEREQSKASGVVYEQLFVRHWDTWADGRYNQLFVADLDARGAGTVRAVGPVVGGVPGNVPSRPFGGDDEYTWAPDGQSLVFSARLATRDEPWSTNFDLYLYKPGQPLQNLTFDDRTTSGGPSPSPEGKNRAWDTGPVFSADGRTLYYRAMKRPGFEADRFGLMARDMVTGATREIAPDWDRSADGIVLSADGRTIYTTAQDTGEHPLFAVDIASGTVNRVVDGGTVTSFDVAGDTVALTRNTLRSNDVLVVASLREHAETTAQRADGQHVAGALRAITPEAGDLLKDVRFGEYEQFNFPGWNGETVHGYVVKPWNYEEGRQYPVAFLIHGGPQGSFGNGWSYRWNPQTYAGQGYAVVMIDFHGSTGYGQAFTDAISGDWGGKPLVDLQKGWAAAQQKYPFLDGDKACALGASYGGYMINWIAGNWFDEAGNAPFKCLVNHDGVFDTRSMGYVTEELWFTEWENRGTPFQNPEGYEKFNPVNHVAKWRVPMLVVQGEKDYRVPVDQGLSTFTALQRKGIESKLLYFPDENHWVLKPHNSVLWHDTVNAWLKQHIGQ